MFPMFLFKSKGSFAGCLLFFALEIYNHKNFIKENVLKTILVFAHEYNTYDKHSLIEKENKFARKTNMKLKTFFKDKKLMEFYMNI